MCMIFCQNIVTFSKFNETKNQIFYCNKFGGLYWYTSVCQSNTYQTLSKRIWCSRKFWLCLYAANKMMRAIYLIYTIYLLFINPSTNHSTKTTTQGTIWWKTSKYFTRKTAF